MNLTERPYLLCEVANVHGGDASCVESIIREFGQLPYERKGIKFQIFKSDRIALPDFEWFSVYERLYFDRERWGELIQQASFFGGVWIDVFDTYGVEVLSENLSFVEGLKLQASILENHEVFDALSRVDLSGKKLIINVSGFDIDQVFSFVDRFKCVCSSIVLQIGYQSYPTGISDTGLQKIPVLRAAFPGLDICIADHADAETDFSLRAPIYGVLLGCSYIEKHMCLSRKESPYDKYSALEPSQMKALCEAIKDLQVAATGKFVQDAEHEYLRKSIQIPVLKREVRAGSLLSSMDFLYRRTSKVGISASAIKKAQAARYILAVSKEKNSAIVEQDYRPARVAAIVACRMKSSRLPKKAILPIAGMPSVERCLEQCFGVAGVDQVILATSDLPSDDELVLHTLGGRASLWRGHPDDVIGRYIGACEKFEVDVVVRITADCPLVVPEILEYLLDRHFEDGADYTAARNCAVGSSGEIINVDSLRRVAEYFGVAKHSEYMTWYFQNNQDVFKVNLVDLPEDYIRPYRMTLDYPEDMKFFEGFYRKCNGVGGVKRAAEIFKVLDESPEVTSINAHLELKYRTDRSLIDILDSETRMQSVGKS